MLKKVSLFFYTQIGYTALHIAAENGNTEIVKLLIDAGIILNIRDQVSRLQVTLTIITQGYIVTIILMKRRINENVNVMRYYHTT